MATLRLRFAVLAVLSSPAFAACSSVPPEDATNPSSSGEPATPSSATGEFGGGVGEAVAPPAELAACASAAVATKLDDVNLVFMMDQSDSMASTRAKKWTPVSLATKKFFTDAGSVGLKASVDYFPTTKSSAPNGCADVSYSSPDVALTALPAATLSASVDAHGPGGHSGTPTLPALSGALSYAKTLNGKTAVVLVTDGEPAGCSDNKVASVAARAALDAAKIKTYVVGVGSSLGKLDDIAAGGGTGKAIIVSVGDPEKTKNDLLAAFSTVREQTTSCEAALPAPPAGQTLDLAKVNVVWKTAGGEYVLAYSQDCSQDGWSYDNVTAPTKVVLCSAACGRVKGEGKLSVAFGCATKVTVR